jgi:hypothetical protein
MMYIILAASVVAPMAFAQTGTASNPIPPQFYLNATTTTLCRGTTNYVQLAITNPSKNIMDQLQSVELSIGKMDGLYPALVYAGTVNASTTLNVTMPVFAGVNTSSFITVPVSVNFYYFAALYTDSEERNVTFDVVSCPSSLPLEMNVSPGSLVTGQINNLTFGFTNTGNTTLTNVSAKAAISSSQSGMEFVGYEPIVIDAIAPHSTVYVPERMYENGSQIFYINVSATFINQSRLEQAADSFSMLSGGTIDMIPSSISVTPSTVSPGSIFSIAFTVTDTGTSSVSNANAAAILPAGFGYYGVTTSDYIGSIGIESPTAVSLALMANSSVRPGTYNIPVKLSYQGNFRQNMSSMVNVSVTVGSSSGSASGLPVSGAQGGGSSGSTAIYIMAVVFVIAVAAIFAYPRFMNRKAQGPRRT